MASKFWMDERTAHATLSAIIHLHDPLRRQVFLIWSGGTPDKRKEYDNGRYVETYLLYLTTEHLDSDLRNTNVRIWIVRLDETTK